MFFSIYSPKHTAVRISKQLPDQLKMYQYAGSVLQLMEGDFGRVISQLIPSDEYSISLHFLFLDQFTWLQFPFDRIDPLLLYVTEDCCRYGSILAKSAGRSVPEILSRIPSTYFMGSTKRIP